MKRVIITATFISILTIAALNKSNTDIAITAVLLANKKLTVVSCSGAVCKVPTRSVAFKNIVKKNILSFNDNNAEMKLISGGTFKMGTADYEDCKPVHAVTLKPFFMDVHEVTNAQFKKFIKATGYITIAELPLNSKDFPGVPEDKLVAGSAVFTPTAQRVSLDDPFQWWVYLAGANWQHPAGAAPSIVNKEQDPVVQVCYADAVAYATWAGKRLPTEAEWEFTARAGRPYSKYYWGDILQPAGK